MVKLEDTAEAIYCLLIKRFSADFFCQGKSAAYYDVKVQVLLSLFEKNKNLLYNIYVR
jgi:hypothetical protein